jgi:hypothetical protein
MRILPQPALIASWDVVPPQGSTVIPVLFKTDPSTTATVKGLGWRSGLWLRQVWVKYGRDAIPQAHADPEGIACIDGLPGSARRGGLAPRCATAHHRKHAFQLASQIAIRTPPPRRRWDQQRCDLLPVPLGERGCACNTHDGERSMRCGPRLRRRWTLCAPGLMSPTSRCLVLAPPHRPVEVVRTLGALRQGHELHQAPHLRHGQGNQFCSIGSGAPPSVAAGASSSWAPRAAASALRRVTSRAAWATRTSVLCRCQAS